METLKRILRTKEIRNALLFLVFVVIVFRVAAHVPVPGIDATALTSLLAGNQFLGLLNMFSGGTLGNFSIVALGVSPYITSSIIFQLLGMIFQVLRVAKGRAGSSTFESLDACCNGAVAFCRRLASSNFGV